tara:strand:+ start:2273 stop:3799 length:1527 start_codon:yes stop_codon:yes gene_type:complete
MYPSMIQKTYGTPASATAQLETPILSLAAGYHRFFARPGAQTLTNVVETGATINPLGKGPGGKTQYVRLFKTSQEDARGNKLGYGDYRGNYIVYKYKKESDLKRLRRDIDLEQYPSGDSMEGVPIIDRALKGVTQRMNAVSHKEIISQPGLRSAEEQTAALGLAPQGTTGGAANPVDLKLGGRGYQVTYTKEYTKLSGHSIYGQTGLGGTLKTAVIKARRDQKRHKTSKHSMYKKMSAAGLEYFQGRIPMWNHIMRQIQKDNTMSATELRGKISGTMVANKARGLFRDHTGRRIQGIAMEGFKGMLHGSTGLFTKAASQITMTALGNQADYGEGVFNATPLDRGVHSLVGLFMLAQDPFWRFRESEMRHAHVLYGLDATTALIARDGSAFDAFDVNEKRTHAQHLTDAMSSKSIANVGEILGSTAARHITDGGRILPSINIKAANRDLSDYIYRRLVPIIRQGASTAIRDGGIHDILGDGFTDTMGKASFTALPYLSVFDSIKSRYGK